MSEPYVSRSAGLYASKAIPGDFKKIILCCDGTWQAADKGFRSMPSNVVKMSRALSRHQVAGNKEIQQIVYYQSGVATAEVGSFARKLYGNLGMGLDQNVISAYYFLANNYDPGDEIYMFGFSRGAYTVRTVADLVAKLGLLDKEHIDQFSILYGHYRERTSDEKFEADHRAELELYRTRRTKIKVIGVWDTVGSMGFPQDWPWWITYPIGKLLGLKQYGKPFRDANISNNVEHAFQAMGLDEHRAAFSPALWHLPPKKEGEPETELIQCWFPGSESTHYRHATNY
ncbi:hypothetical protein ABW19_dt0202423 [Dactylella cylindrospora]|nr:hypothetical protein ABW19_dt0202423 [Dactylella cylindrospora]